MAVQISANLCLLTTFLCDLIFNLELQEDSVKTGKLTSAGMYFLHFQVYRLDPTVNAVGCLDLLSYSF
jgi:hypothetical protein